MVGFKVEAEGLSRGGERKKGVKDYPSALGLSSRRTLG